VLATKVGYEPSWIMVDGAPASSLAAITLRNEAPAETREFHVGDHVIAREFEWCNAQIVTLGTGDTPTTAGVSDMSGRIEVKYDDSGTTQWLFKKDVRLRPSVPLENPIKCPSLLKRDLAKGTDEDH
jgi:hypothetical protein